jgi:hypothetical protein
MPKKKRFEKIIKLNSLFLFLAESDTILVRPCAGFPSADIVVVQTGIYVQEQQNH